MGVRALMENWMGGEGSGRIGYPLREAQVDEFARLNEWSQALNDSMQLRANVVLLLLGGMAVSDVAARLGANVKTIYAWRSRWNSRGLKGLYTRQKRTDEKREGVNLSMKRMIEDLDSTNIDRDVVIALTLQFMRDVPRDKHDDKDRTGSKLRLEGLRLLERLTSKPAKTTSGGAELPEWMKGN